MAKNLVIVESPAKAKTIGKMLGRNYKVVASMGHLRDLPKSSLGVNIEDNYEPKYITIRGKGPIVADLKKEAKKSEKVYLATDPDREGEAISWHIAQMLKLEDSKNRITFGEITKNAVKEGGKNQREIDIDLVDAQQARRILDRLVGYQISPLLWQKIQSGLSAGRVQSVVLKLICDREKEINAFKPEEYWKIIALHEEKGIAFESECYGICKDGKDIPIDKIRNKEEADELLKRVDKDSFELIDVNKSKRERKPYAPYMTSTLQQEASNYLGFSTRKTMQIAQMLYEGVNLGKEGTTGLITYMRTDSTRISDEIVKEAKEYIIKQFGKEYSNGGNNYSFNKKNAQDAHEGIRPSAIQNTPSKVKPYLTKDQFALYQLIWKRTLASQMASTVTENTRWTFLSGDVLFRANGSVEIFDGFQRVYPLNTKETVLPQLSKGVKIFAKEINANQLFTKPPARYTEASLIKNLEKLGIGRPSTYSPTIATILARRYVRLTKKVFYPTELGETVNELLEEYFPDIVDVKFTARMEQQLDDIIKKNEMERSLVILFLSRNKRSSQETKLRMVSMMNLYAN